MVARLGHASHASARDDATGRVVLYMSHLKYPGRLVKLLGLFVFLRNGSNYTVICEI